MGFAWSARKFFSLLIDLPPDHGDPEQREDTERDQDIVTDRQDVEDWYRIQRVVDDGGWERYYSHERHGLDEHADLALV